MLKTKSMKRADSTIEIALAIVMAVIALYFVLNLFSGNIQTTVKSSGIYRALYKNNADAKTAYVKDPNPIKTQINVQIVGDQGSLAEYHRDAAATIERYATESKTETLTDENRMNLAEQLTIFAESGPTAPINELTTAYITGTSKSYYQFGADNGVHVYMSSPNFYTTIDMKDSKVWTKSIAWGGLDGNGHDINKYLTAADNARNTNTPGSPVPQVRVQNIETIKSIFDSRF